MSWSNIWGKGGSGVCDKGEQSNRARQDHNELQLVILQEYRLEATCESHNDVCHLSLEQMLEILWDWFYSPNLEADAKYHLCTCGVMPEV